MNLLRKTILILSFPLFAVTYSCKSSGVDLEDLDLMKYGLPVKIKAPAEAEVESSDLGFVRDVTVKGDGNFSIQIIGGTATTTDPSQVKMRQLESVKSGPFFSEVISEDDNGFIFKKQISETGRHGIRFSDRSCRKLYSG